VDLNYAKVAESSREAETAAVESGQLTLQDPRAVLSMLEADQVVAAKRTHFGRQKLSFGMRVLLWGLRVYVVVMLVIVAISVLRAVHLAR
jgi:hypothetical protein